MGTFKVVFYTKGCYVKDPDLKYNGGEVYAFSSQDPAMFVLGNKCEIEIYCEPKLDEGDFTLMDNAREKGKGKSCEEDKEKISDCSGESSDESVRDVHFDDN
ncbi:unnamed protein product [Vicia faba]|uniref:Uncharacterized protein n=1 Tax=Vicia faba TaxID=3906 RepID=A0AAV1AXJ6_VICFA|nr:unnamed protein product [Vicia faba]